jgi:hypothetical protein
MDMLLGENALNIELETSHERRYSIRQQGNIAVLKRQ